jgi:cytochrome c-type biogenesis protein CcmH/NrfG
MKARRVVLVLCLVLAFYFVLIGYRGIVMIRDGRPAFVLLGLGVVLLPLVGLWVVGAELRFGQKVQGLARELEAAGELPEDEVARLASGRVDRASADALFEVRKGEVEAEPANWKTWFRLAVAYDDARDRRRAREAMRTAVRLHSTV